MSDVEGIKRAVGVGYRKHISEYDSKLVAIPMGFPDKKELVEHETNELTSVCPVTGLPDFYNLKISYIPDKLLVELKSLKFYLMQYRDVGILHEDLAQKVLQDFVAVVQPTMCVVDLTAASRGGISTHVTVMYPEEK
jgi:7-cyano-7-deazaguanine reductase